MLVGGKDKRAGTETGWGVARSLVGALGPPLVTVAIILVGWEVAVVAGVLPTSAFPRMTETAAALGSLVMSYELWALTGATLESWGLGLGIAACIAVPLGMMIGAFPAIDRAISLPIEFLRPLPPVALIPLSLLVWGPSLRMKLFLVAFGTTWPILLQVVYGMRSIDPIAQDTVRSFKLSRYRTITKLILPSVLPFILTGLRIAVAMALIISIVAELVGGTRGIGQALFITQSSGALPEMYAYIFFSGLLGYVLNQAFAAVEKRSIPWHVSTRGG